MRKLTLLILILLCLNLVSAGFIQSGSSPQIKTTLIDQSPDPVEPGQIVTVTFKINNEGEETKDDVIVKLLPKHPFTIYGDSLEKNIGKLLAGTSEKPSSIEVEFKLKVHEDAAEEETEIELKVIVGEGAKSYMDNEFLIDIQTHDAILDVTSIKVNPEKVPPGGTADVSVMVKNLADSLLKDVKFKLNFADDDLPLAPYQSSSERRISNLKSGFQDSLNFKLIASPEASAGLYKIPMNVTYNDEKGKSYSFNDILAISIGDAPKLRPFIRRSSVLKANDYGALTLGIANAGATDIKFLEVFLLPSDDYQLISTSDYFYIGDVDSDDTESQEVDIFINRKADMLHFPVRLKYFDANNKNFEQTFDLEMNLYSSSQLKKFGVIDSSNTGFIIFILLLVGIGYYLYRKGYLKKHLKKYLPK